jgi:betaine-homocysteine S-methyltransferase
MSRPSPTTLQQRLAEGVVVGAEGYVFELERRGYVQAGPFVPEVILDAPGRPAPAAPRAPAGRADVMVRLTYYAHREKLEAVGRAGDLEEMNRQAVRIANEVAAEGGALVAGNICNTWSYDPEQPRGVGSRWSARSTRSSSAGRSRRAWTSSSRRRTTTWGRPSSRSRSARSSGLPAMVTFASVQDAATYDGYDYVEACRILADKGAAVVGLNCSAGPETMLPLLERIRAAVDVPVAAQPVPYRTSAATPAFERLESATGATCSRSRSSRSSARASRWRTSRAGPGTSA